MIITALTNLPVSYIVAPVSYKERRRTVGEELSSSWIFYIQLIVKLREREEQERFQGFMRLLWGDLLTGSVDLL